MKTNNIFDIIFVGDSEGKTTILSFLAMMHYVDIEGTKNIQNWRCMISILKGVPTEIPRFRNQNLRGLCDGHCSARSIPTENHKSAKRQLKWPQLVFMWCVVIFGSCVFLCLFIDSPTRSGLSSMPLSCLVLSSLCLCCVFFVFDYFFVILLICFSFY